MYNVVRHIRQSLSMKLIISILLLAVPIFVVSIGFLFFKSRANIKREATEHARSMLNTSVYRVDRYLRIAETATNVTAWLVEENFEPDSILAYSRRVVELNGNVDGCSISAEPDMFPQFGRYCSAYTIREGDSITSDFEQPYEYFSRIWYENSRNSKRPGWTVYYDDIDSLDFTLSGMVASYSKPLFTPDSTILGIISTDVSLTRLSKMITAYKPYPNSYFVMVDRRGQFYIHPDSTRLFTRIYDGVDPVKQSDLIALGHEMASGKEGSMSVMIDGEPCVVCYKPIRNALWNMAIICSENDILKGYRQLTFIIIPILIIGLALILFFGRKSVIHAISPLELLAKQSQRIATGHYDAQIAQSKRRDAVGQLQNSFKQMQSSLNRHMSEIQKVNNETAKRNEELTKANQLAEEAAQQKTTFIHNMTHQIRTPLNIVMGFAQVLEGNFEKLPKEEAKSLASLMNLDAMKLRRMVYMLYDSSEMGIFEENTKYKHDEIISCNKVALDSIDFAQRHFPNFPPITFKTVLPDSFSIYSNYLFLYRSLRELLCNSIKYSDGEHVSISVSATEEYVEFVTEDKGSGIAEEHRDHIFKPFAKINDLSEGLGLGLPLTIRHVSNLGGTMNLDTTYVDGCRFIIRCPSDLFYTEKD